MRITILFLILSFMKTVFTQSITVSHLIGEKLEPVERNFYKLFPEFKNFVEAEFFLSSDSLLDARITYTEDEEQKDSLIKNYSNIPVIQKYLIKELIHALVSNENEITLMLNNDSKIEGYLYSVDDDSVYVFNMYNRELISFNNKNVKKIVITEKASVIPYAVAGSCIGGIIGFEIGKNSAEAEEKNLFDFSELEGGCTGGLAGGLAGMLFGVGVGSTISYETEFFADNDGCFCELKDYSILPAYKAN